MDERVSKIPAQTAWELMPEIPSSDQPVFTHFRPASHTSNCSVSDRLWQALGDPIPAYQPPGFIYAYTSTSTPGMLKISFTSKRNPSICVQEEGRKCKRQLSLIFSTTISVRSACRLRKLVVEELYQHRYREECQGCGATHQNWFAVDEQHAKAVAYKWMAFLSMATYTQKTSSSDWTLAAALENRESLKMILAPLQPKDQMKPEQIQELIGAATKKALEPANPRSAPPQTPRRRVMLPETPPPSDPTRNATAPSTPITPSLMRHVAMPLSPPETPAEEQSTTEPSRPTPISQEESLNSSPSVRKARSIRASTESKPFYSADTQIDRSTHSTSNSSSSRAISQLSYPDVTARDVDNFSSNLPSVSKMPIALEASASTSYFRSKLTTVDQLSQASSTKPVHSVSRTSSSQTSMDPISQAIDDNLEPFSSPVPAEVESPPQSADARRLLAVEEPINGWESFNATSHLLPVAPKPSAKTSNESSVRQVALEPRYSNMPVESARSSAPQDIPTALHVPEASRLRSSSSAVYFPIDPGATSASSIPAKLSPEVLSTAPDHSASVSVLTDLAASTMDTVALIATRLHTYVRSLFLTKSPVPEFDASASAGSQRRRRTRDCSVFCPWLHCGVRVAWRPVSTRHDGTDLESQWPLVVNASGTGSGEEIPI